MAYSKEFKSDSYLVNFMGGAGRGVARAGEALVGLGNDKIKRAKEDALKKELKAKQRAIGSANNAKNRALNPEAVKKIAKSYGIDENSPLYKKGSPSQFNADLNLANLGKADKVVSPKVKSVVENADGTYTNVFTDGTEAKTNIKVPKKTYKPETPRVIESYVGEDEYKHTTMSDGTKYKSAYKVRQTQKSASSSKPIFVLVEALTPKQAAYSQKHKLRFKDKDGRIVVDITRIPKVFSSKKGSMSKGKDLIFGNEGGF